MAGLGQYRSVIHGFKECCSDIPVLVVELVVALIHCRVQGHTELDIDDLVGQRWLFLRAAARRVPYVTP